MADRQRRPGTKPTYRNGASKADGEEKSRWFDRIDEILKTIRGDEQFLNHWIAKYVLQDDKASIAETAKFPLREAHIEVEAVENKPGSFRAVAYLRPHFQLDELSVSLRCVVLLPDSAR
jgi:predicted component of type VI protein secretion system